MARQFSTSDITSCELSFAYDLADRLASLESFQRLTETSTEGEARKRVVLGISNAPRSGSQFTRDELEEIFVDAVIQPAEEDDHEASEGDTNDTQRVSGVLRIRFRRQVRESESIDQEFMFFWNDISTITEKIRPKNLENPIIPIVSRSMSMLISDHKEKEGQGEHLTAELTIPWGDQE